MEPFDWNNYGMSAIEAIAAIIRSPERSRGFWVQQAMQDLRRDGWDIPHEHEQAMFWDIEETWSWLESATPEERAERVKTYSQLDQDTILSYFASR